MSDQLVKVIFVGNADSHDQTGKISLERGENGEERSLTLGGSPDDALVTPNELHMLTGRFQIEVVEEGPQTSEVATPSGGSGASSVPFTPVAQEPATPIAPPAA